MCDIVAVRGRQAASEVILRLGSLTPNGTRPSAVAELGGDRGLREPRFIGSATVSRVRAFRGERPIPVGRLAIGRSSSAGQDPDRIGDVQPLTDCGGAIVAVHCGNIDNAADLRGELEVAGHRFGSANGSGVIPHVIEDELGHGVPAFEAFQAAIERLRGTWAIAALIARHNSIFIARCGVSLAVRGTLGRCVVATDPAATEGVRGPLRILEDGSIAELGTMWRWAGASGRAPAPANPADIDPDVMPPAAEEWGRRHNTLQHH